MRKVIAVFLAIFSISLAQTFETYLHQDMFMLKIKKGQSVKLPLTDMYLTVVDIKDGKAYVKISPEKEKSSKVFEKSKIRMDISDVISNAVLYKKDCKTDKILDEKKFVSYEKISCWSNKEKQCKNSDVYYDEVCETYTFPVLEFGQYYTDAWAFNVSLVSDNYVVISFMPRKPDKRKVPVH